MSNKNIPVKIEFGGIDNVSPILGSINLRISGLTKKFESLQETTKKLTFAATFLALNQFGKNLQGFSDKMSQSFQGTIHDVSNLEDNINRIRILMGKDADSTFVSNLTKQWKNLSEISTFTQSEISDVSKDILNSGVRDKGFLTQLTEKSLLLSDASKKELSATEGFQILNEFKNTYKIKPKNIGDLTDQIVYGREQGSLGYKDIEDAFKYASPVLGAVTNADPAQFLALASLLSNHGIKGSTMGTATRKMVVQLVPNMNQNSIDKLEKSGAKDEVEIAKILDKGHNGVLQRLNITPAKISDKEGLIDLPKAFHLIKEQLPKLSSDQQLSTIKQLFGTEALSAGLTLTKFLDEFDSIYKKIKNEHHNKAQEQAESTRNTLESKINQSKHSWENLKTSIMQSGVDDSLKKIFGSFQSITQKIDDMNPKWKQFIGFIGLGTYGFVELNAKLSPIIINLMGISMVMKSLMGFTAVQSILSGIIPVLAVVNLGLKTAVISTLEWAVAMMANPVTWIVLGVVAAIAAVSVGIYAIIKNWAYLKEQFTMGVDAIKHSFDNIFHQENYPTKSYSQNENGKSDVNVTFQNLPSGAKVIQKTKNMKLNLSLGYMGVAHF